MTEFSATTRHCVLIPSYNSGPLLAQTVLSVLAHARPVIVIDDGSSDGSVLPVQEMAFSEPDLEVLVSPENSGKGGAVMKGLELAHSKGFTHAVVFDSDGQHEAADLPRFLQASRRHPEAMILGVPVFGPEAPMLRIKGRLVGNWWTNLETLWGGVNDSLFGFRIYPIFPLLEIMREIRGGRHFDFDTQMAVRLYWRGIPPLNLPTRVSYPPKTSGGVSHFRYLRDNLLLVGVHTGLTLQAILLLPRLIRFRSRPPLIDP